MSKKSSGGSPRPSVAKAVYNDNTKATNPNKGTSGTNTSYDKAQGHRGMQIGLNVEAAKASK